MVNCSVKKTTSILVKDARRQFATGVRHLPRFLWGAPGVAKSALVRAIAEELGASIVEFRAPVRVAEDIGGMPMPDKDCGEVKYLPLSDLARCIRARSPIILFCDEFSSAEEAVKKASFQLVEGICPNGLGDLDPKCVYTVAAGNRPEDNTWGEELGDALATRFVHLGVTMTPNEWLEWASSKKGVKEISRTPHFIRWMKFRGEEFFLATQWRDPKSGAYLNARTAEEAVLILADEEYTDDEKTALFEGAVGEATATDYFAFVETMAEDLPLASDYLAGKVKDGFNEKWELSRKSAWALALAEAFCAIPLAQMEDNHLRLFAVAVAKAGKAIAQIAFNEVGNKMPLIHITMTASFPTFDKWMNDESGKVKAPTMEDPIVTEQTEQTEQNAK